MSAAYFYDMLPLNSNHKKYNMLQQEALHLLKMGKNVFLTGEAGSGKTYLLNQYIRYLKEYQVKVAVTASTGIAATHLNGSTVHAWSGIGIKNELSPTDIDKLISSARFKRNYKKTRVLIIDEISMLHPHQLDMIDTIARQMLNPDTPFGGLQVILCGDFFQLPPVSAESRSDQDKRFAFESSSWLAGDFHVCYLHEQHRQGNDPLYSVLNDIRAGSAGEHTKVPLRTRYKKEPGGSTKATKLYSRNVNVDMINAKELALLPGDEKTFEVETAGLPALVDGLIKNCLAPQTLKLKIGAQVMFVKNDIMSHYSNGTRGIVTAFEKNDDAWPIVTTYDNRIVIAKPEDWTYEDNGVVRASITQVPLRLAWAITIHKSQGMTLDAAEIDLGDAFEPGMGYVALSRVRRLDGLKLMNLNEMALSVHPKILTQDTVFKQCSAQNEKTLQDLPIENISQLEKETLFDRFGGSTEKKTKTPNQSKVPTHLITLEIFKKTPSIEAIAAERGLTQSTILQHIEKLNGLQLVTLASLNPLRSTIPTETYNTIFSAFLKSSEGSLTSIFNALEGKYPYEMIRLVRLFVS